MYSMNRTMWPVPRKRSAIGTISWSFTPRFTTMLILTGLNPARPASSMACSTGSTENPTSFIDENTVSSTASRLTVSRVSPAARSRRARLRVRSDPLVVRVRSLEARNRGEHPNEVFEPLAKERLATGQPNLPDPVCDENLGQPDESPRRTAARCAA